MVYLYYPLKIIVTKKNARGRGATPSELLTTVVLCGGVTPSFCGIPPLGYRIFIFCGVPPLGYIINLQIPQTLLDAFH
jgi:hypothetical protein